MWSVARRSASHSAPKVARPAALRGRRNAAGSTAIPRQRTGRDAGHAMRASRRRDHGDAHRALGRGNRSIRPRRQTGRRLSASSTVCRCSQPIGSCAERRDESAEQSSRSATFVRRFPGLSASKAVPDCPSRVAGHGAHPPSRNPAPGRRARRPGTAINFRGCRPDHPTRASIAT